MSLSVSRTIMKMVTDNNQRMRRFQTSVRTPPACLLIRSEEITSKHAGGVRTENALTFSKSSSILLATPMNQISAVTEFRRLHELGCFVLPNPWDAGSAIYLEHLGFKALATTSAGFAFSKGFADGPAHVTLDLMLDHFREIAAATSLPVNADFQNGYADDPDGVAANVKLCVATGVAGLSIEDSTGNSSTPLYETDLAVERIKAARAAIDESDQRVVLTARCEAWLVGAPEPLRVALQRLAAFADAGADCLYAPGATTPDQISAIVKAVAPKPVNVIMPIGGQA